MGNFMKRVECKLFNVETWLGKFPNKQYAIEEECINLHSATELLLKELITNSGREVPETHDIERLLRVVYFNAPEYLGAAKYAEELNRWYIGYSHADPIEDVSEEHVIEVLKAVEKFKDFVKNLHLE